MVADHFQQLAITYYKETYGINICDYNPIVFQMMENLFYKGKHLSREGWKRKFLDYGVELDDAAMNRIRFNALIKRLPAEPRGLSTWNAVQWYESFPKPYTREERLFICSYSPVKVAMRFPSLCEAYIMSTYAGEFTPFIKTEIVAIV